MYRSYWESIDECRKDVVKHLRSAYADREKCEEIDGDDILSLLGCIPINICLSSDAEKPFCYSTKELLYLTELFNSDIKEKTMQNSVEITHIDGNTSDGYHTFNELYHHRTVLFAVIVAYCQNMAWKSKLHSDGTMYDGMFIAGIDTPAGPATYHCDNSYWDMFKCKELDKAPEWDGHTPDQAIKRMEKLIETIYQVHLPFA